MPELISSSKELAQPILDALNNGASLDHLIAAVDQVGGPIVDLKGNNRMFVNTLSSHDLTGDGVPEILFHSLDWLAIFTCQRGQYVQVFDQAGDFLKVNINDLFTRDINRDGLQELIYRVYDFNPVDGLFVLYIYAWDGGEFRNLILMDVGDKMGFYYPYGSGGSLGGFTHEAGSSITFPVINNRGIHNVVIKGDFICFSCRKFGPWRWFTDTFTWNGSGYQYLGDRLDPPVYRFQAVQDGDQESLRGSYTTALELYHQALEDKHLKGWSEALYHQQVDIIDAEYRKMATPTPLPPDPNEYAVLSAYIRYRILLIHSALGQFDQARSDIEAFQQEVLSGQPGYAYLTLATEFWNTYQGTRDLAAACAKTRQYAGDHYEDIYQPIDSTWHGWQSPTYEKNGRLICPLD